MFKSHFCVCSAHFVYACVLHVVGSRTPFSNSRDLSGGPHFSMALLARDFASSLRRFLQHQDSGAQIPTVLTLLSCGFNEVLLLFQMMSDEPQGYGAMFRCIFACASMVSQMIGATILRETDFLQAHDEGRDAIWVASELNDLKADIGKWSSALAHWMSNAPVTGHNGAERVLEACLGHLNSAMELLEHDLLRALVSGICEVRPKLVELLERKAHNDVMRQGLVGSTGSSGRDTGVYE